MRKAYYKGSGFKFRRFWFALLVMQMLWCTSTRADKADRSTTSKRRDSKSDYPLSLRIEEDGQHFWQNTGQNAQGNPFYFSGPHYGGNKFDWKKNISGALSNIRLYIRKGNTTIKWFVLQGNGANWTDTGFVGVLQNTNPDQPRYLDSGGNGQETYTAIVVAQHQGKWVKSNPVDFDVRSRIIFWYDSTDNEIDKGMPNALGVAVTLGSTSDDAASDSEVLLCVGNWDTAWACQTVRGEFRSYDHGGPLYVDVNNNGDMDPDDRGTYAHINIGEANAKYTGFNQAGLGVAGNPWPPGTHIPQTLFLPAVTVRLNHCHTASRSCGHTDTPQNPWPLVAQIDNQNSPRIIDTMNVVGTGVGSGVVKGWKGAYTWEFAFPFQYSLTSATGQPTQDQIDQLGDFLEGLVPTSYVSFQAQHGGTDQGWCTYLAAQGKTWAQNQFQDTTMNVTVTGSHQMTENPDNATEHQQAYD